MNIKILGLALDKGDIIEYKSSYFCAASNGVYLPSRNSLHFKKTGKTIELPKIFEKIIAKHILLVTMNANIEYNYSNDFGNRITYTLRKNLILK